MDQNNLDWNAISAVTTAIGVITALALGLWANWLQYMQAKAQKKQTQHLAAAWSAGLAADIANTLVRAQKLNLQISPEECENSFRFLLSRCSAIEMIETSYIDIYLDRLDVFPIQTASSISAFHSEVKRLGFISDRIKSGANIHLPDGSDAFAVLRRCLTSIIGYGEIATQNLYNLASFEAAPNTLQMAKESFERDKLRKQND